MAHIEAPFWHPACMNGYILDWDGVLADTSLDFGPIRKRYFNGARVPLVEGGRGLSPDLRNAMEKDLYDLEMEGAARARPVDGAHDLLEWLENTGIPWAVVSRNCLDSIREAASRCDISLPDLLFTRDGGPLKPDPRALLGAARALGAAPTRCVMVGDFLYDILGARRAGMRAVLVERVEQEWLPWVDASYPTMKEFVASIYAPRPLAPWEYLDIVATRGADWLKKVWKLKIALPENAYNVLELALRAASLGAGAISVPGAPLSLEQWLAARFLPVSRVDVPLSEVVTELLRERYPQAMVMEGSQGEILPKEPEEVESFLEALVQ
ncbi:MAG: HAD-IA family hydrolase [Synergistota bacterium]|nr:HAD-IA family hydrolase [Synergistota bacterium]